MKKLILLTLMLTIASVSNAQNVSIPDANFKNALISAGVDTSGDGEISYAEAEAVTSLDVSNKNISNMSGIEAFINLDTLHCSWNEITNLDVSKNTALTILGCDDNQIASLDVSNNTALTYLYCMNNQLTGLDVSNNTALTGLYCFSNQLTSLDVSKNTALTMLGCQDNQLASLDISNNSAIGSGDFRFDELHIGNMPTLHEVCVWTIPFPPDGVHVSTTGSPNVCFETDCNGECDNTLVNEYTKSKLSIYPNPTFTLLTIETATSDMIHIEITSLNGQKVFEEERMGDTQLIDLTSFQKGVYLISVRSKDFVVTRKIIKLF